MIDPVIPGAIPAAQQPAERSSVSTEAVGQNTRSYGDRQGSPRADRVDSYQPSQDVRQQNAGEVGGNSQQSRSVEAENAASSTQESGDSSFGGIVGGEEPPPSVLNETTDSSADNSFFEPTTVDDSVPRSEPEPVAVPTSDALQIADPAQMRIQQLAMAAYERAEAT